MIDNTDKDIVGACMVLHIDLMKFYKADLVRWMEYVLLCFLKKMETDGNETVKNVLDVIKISFDGRAQFLAVCKFIVGQVPSPTIKELIVVLEYLCNGLCKQPRNTSHCGQYNLLHG